MNYNPYAPPQPPPDGAFASPQAGPLSGTPQNFSSTEVIGAAWELFKRHAGLLIGAMMVMGLIQAPITYAPTVLFMAKVLSPLSVEFHVTTLVCSLVNQVVSAYLGVGFARMAIAIVRGQEPSFGYLFAGKGAGRNIVLSLGMGLFTTVATLIRIVAAGTGISEITVVASGWTVVMLVPLVLVWLAVSQAPYFIVDKDMGLGDAVRASIDATRGKRGELFLTALLGGLLFVAGALACGIGVLVTCPIYLMIFPIVYTRLTGQDPSYGGYGGFAGGFGAPGGPPPAGGFGGPPGGYGGGGYGPPSQGGGYGPPGGGYGGPQGY
jgi:uncharacterized membrane protein